MGLFRKIILGLGTVITLGGGGAAYYSYDALDGSPETKTALACKQQLEESRPCDAAAGKILADSFDKAVLGLSGGAGAGLGIALLTLGAAVRRKKKHSWE